MRSEEEIRKELNAISFERNDNTKPSFYLNKGFKAALKWVLCDQK